MERWSDGKVRFDARSGYSIGLWKQIIEIKTVVINNCASGRTRLSFTSLVIAFSRLGLTKPGASPRRASLRRIQCIVTSPKAIAVARFVNICNR